MFSIRVLDPAQATAYEALTFPSYRSWLSRLEANPEVAAVGAAVLGRPAGLALARVYDDEGDKVGVAHSIYVLPPYRRSGGGTALLAALEEVLRGRGCRRLVLTYETGKPSTAAMERLIEKREWEAPHLHRLVFKLDVKRLEAAPWLYSLGRLPEGFGVFPWAELTDEDRRSVEERQEREAWIPDFAMFNPDASVDAASSIGLRYRDEVVGWFVNREMDAETVSVEAWVRQDLRRVGRSVLLAGLIRESLQRVLTLTPYKYGIVVPGWEPMIAFGRRHLAPWCASVNESRRSRKLLGD